MIKVALNGIHDFKKTKDFTQHDRFETFNQVQCTNCRMIGRRIDREPFVYVSDTYSKERIELCQRDNFIDKYLGKQIQTICNIRGTKEYTDIKIYSVHTIVKPPTGFINGEQGIWIMSDSDNPIKLHPDEYIEYPLHPIQHNKRIRTQPPIIKSKRTSVPIIKSKRTSVPIIKRKRTN
jgi:hypothetical protein